jgi:hypothetical protein
MKAWLLAGAMTALATSAIADPGPQFRVDYSNPGIAPSNWTLTIYPNGSGHFHSERGKAPEADPPAMEAPNVDRDIRLSAEFADHVFEEAQSRAPHDKECESHLKVAFQGWKKLTFSRPGGGWSCEFNYSRDKQIQALGDSMVAVAGTILEGARLESLLQHDRLGLDQELEFVSDGLGDGRLMQICAISDILERLANDEEVMDRVRKRARILLAKAEK